jgi:hypothetical protein
MVEQRVKLCEQSLGKKLKALHLSSAQNFPRKDFLYIGAEELKIGKREIVNARLKLTEAYKKALKKELGNFGEEAALILKRFLRNQLSNKDILEIKRLGKKQKASSALGGLACFFSAISFLPNQLKRK